MKVIEISPTFFEVGEYQVRLIKKSGRGIITCTCINHVKFCSEQAICHHKEKVLKYVFTKEIRQYVKKMEETYKPYQLTKMDFNIDIVMNDLNNLKRLLK